MERKVCLICMNDIVDNEGLDVHINKAGCRELLCSFYCMQKLSEFWLFYDEIWISRLKTKKEKKALEKWMQRISDKEMKFGWLDFDNEIELLRFASKLGDNIVSINDLRVNYFSYDEGSDVMMNNKDKKICCEKCDKEYTKKQCTILPFCPKGFIEKWRVICPKIHRIEIQKGDL